MNLIQIPEQTKKQKGFSLIELLISFAILSLGIMAVFILMSKNVEYSRFSKDQILASQLAQEGIELLRNLKDNDTEFNDTVETGEYIIDKNKFKINTDPDIFKLYLKYEEGNKFYVHEKDDSEPTKFFRKVDLAVKNDTDGKKIIEERIMVSWNDKGLPSDPADCTLANKCLSVGSIAPDTNIVCTCTGVDLVCQGEPVYYDNCEGQCGVGTKMDGECCASLVVKNQPNNVTGVILSNPTGSPVTNDLIFKSNIAVGGNIVYTDKDGLKPTPAPTSETVYVVHKFDNLSVVNGDGTSSITFFKAVSNVEVLIVGGGGIGNVSLAGGGGGVRLLTKNVTARKYDLLVGSQGANFFGTDSTQVYINGGYPQDTYWDKAGADEEKAAGGGDYVHKQDGGSGSGGYSTADNNGQYYTAPGSGNVPATTPSSQGNDGGFATSVGLTSLQSLGAGGGGAGSAGGDTYTDGTNKYGGDGGDGITSTISGESKVYGAGGGGGAGGLNYLPNFIAGKGGSNGVGGHGIIEQRPPTSEEASGKPWTGSGAGGKSAWNSSPISAYGACGVIIIRYPYSEVSPTLTWGTGNAEAINADGIYTLTDSSGNKIEATVNYLGLPKTDQTDSITVECQ